jgi:hypothetical protein
MTINRLDPRTEPMITYTATGCIITPTTFAINALFGPSTGRYYHTFATEWRTDTGLWSHFTSAMLRGSEWQRSELPHRTALEMARITTIHGDSYPSVPTDDYWDLEDLLPAHIVA